MPAEAEEDSKKRDLAAGTTHPTERCREEVPPQISVGARPNTSRERKDILQDESSPQALRAHVAGGTREMRPPQAVFFDFDGVILESLDVKANAMAELFADRPRHVGAIVRHHIENAGVSRYEKFRYYYRELFGEPLSDAEMSRLDRAFSSLCWEGLMRCPVVPGAVEFLEAWSSRIPMFVVSAAPEQELNRVLQARGLARHFQAAYGSPTSKADNVGRLLKQRDLSPARCLFIGDARADQEAARRHGIPFVQRLTDKAPEPFDPKPVAAIRDLRPLAELWDAAPFPERSVQICDHRFPRFPGTPEKGSWIYLGRDYRAFRRWRRKMPASWTLLEGGEELQEAAAGLRVDYAAWIEKLNEKHLRDPVWWTTQAPEKNPLADPFFYYLCCLLTLRDRIRVGKVPDMIVCEDWGLQNAVRDLFRAHSIPARRTPIWAAPAAQLAEAARFITRIIRFAAHASASLAARALRPAAIIADRPGAALFTFLHEANLESSTYQDRYFPGLLEEWKRRGVASWVIPVLFEIDRPWKAIAWMRKSSQNFVIPQEWLGLSDYLWAIGGAWRSLRLPSSAPPVRGIRVESLLASVRWRQARSKEAFQARLLYRLMHRLKGAGWAPKLIVSWFENHKIDKAVALAVKRSFPEAGHVGYFSATLTPNYLAPFPLKTERAAGALPGRIVCCGRQRAAALRQFDPDASLALGPALRYAPLWGAQRDPGLDPGDAVLMALPSRLSESAALLELLRQVMDFCSTSAAWWIKPHPDHTLSQLKDYLGAERWHPRWRLQAEPLPELLRKSRVVVSGSSGALIEAVCLGVPAIFVSSPMELDFDPLAWLPGVGRRCRTPHEIAAGIEAAFAMDEAALDALKAEGSKTLRDYFEPVSEAALRPFLGPEANGFRRQAATEGS